MGYCYNRYYIPSFIVSHLFDALSSLKRRKYSTTFIDVISTASHKQENALFYFAIVGFDSLNETIETIFVCEIDYRGNGLADSLSTDILTFEKPLNFAPITLASKLFHLIYATIEVWIPLNNILIWSNLEIF